MTVVGTTTRSPHTSHGRVFSAPQKAYLGIEQLEDGGGMDKVPVLVADNETVGGLSDDISMVENIRWGEMVNERGIEKRFSDR